MNGDIAGKYSWRQISFVRFTIKAVCRMQRSLNVIIPDNSFTFIMQKKLQEFSMKVKVISSLIVMFRTKQSSIMHCIMYISIYIMYTCIMPRPFSRLCFSINCYLNKNILIYISFLYSSCRYSLYWCTRPNYYQLSILDQDHHVN